MTISIPYTFSLSSTGGCSATPAAAAFMWLSTVTQGQFQLLGSATAGGLTVNPTGTLVLTVSNLQPNATYYFDVGVGSSVELQ